MLSKQTSYHFLHLSSRKMAKTLKLNGKSIRQKLTNGGKTFRLLAYTSFFFFYKVCSVVEKLTWSLYILTKMSFPLDIGTYNGKQRKLWETNLNNTLLFLFKLKETQ